MSATGPGVRPLAPEDLTPRIDLAQLGFQSTEELTGEPAPLGAERALAALRLGVRLRTPGYNVFVAGLEGAGREARVHDLVAREAGKLPVPPDILYVNNFDDPDRPLVMTVPAGEGRELRRAMDDLIEQLRRRIPEALKKEGFEREKEQITAAYDRQVKELFERFQAAAKDKSVLVRMTGDGHLVFIPLKPDGEPVENPEEYEALPEEHRKMLADGREEIQRLARDFIKAQQEIARKVREDVEAAVRRFATELVEPLVAAIAAAHPHEAVRRHLARVQQNILANLDDFQEEERPQALPFPFPVPSPRDRFVPYQVNLLVDNAGAAGAPIVVEDVPTYQNIFGKIERVIDQTGKLVTNFTRIKAGALLRAAGGFLVFNLDDALTEPLVWKPLKRVLKSGRLEIESFNPFGFLSVSGMTPEPVAVDVRLFVTGSRQVFSLLSAYDPEFPEVFRLLADFVPEECRSEGAERAYALRVARTVRAEGLHHFTREAVAEVLRYGVRASGDRDRVSAYLEEADDLAREASVVAEERGAVLVDAPAVLEALERRAFRADWYEERGRELMKQGTVLIDVEGRAVGQINGLSVLMYGTRMFGRPSRLTASVSLGSAGVVNIEREARLSGSTHDKGVLILAGFLRNRFGQDKPLSFSASLAFEQTYGGVDGDSASSTELYALLSRIGNLPLRQDLAVTGSMNQRGEVQAIGGVNEKIEGFFRTCRRIGLTGTQGVLIPAANVRNLALHPEVIAAVRAGQFAIYPVRTIEEGIEMLTGLPAGAPGEAGTALGIVDVALLDMARRLKEFGAEKGRRENDKEGGPPEAPPAPGQPPPPRPPDPTPAPDSGH
ncbi:MAG TPA: ATP-binding protein [bacterium]